MKSKSHVIFLLFLVVVSLFFCLNAVFIYYVDFPFSAVAVTGKGITGVVSIFVDEISGAINILSPGNATYDFNIGQPYNISLNVTSTFVVDSWWYSLYDLRHSVSVIGDTSFSPNSSFLAARWMNRLTVYANDSSGVVYSDSVDFTVGVPNSAPLLGNISNPILVCEDSSLNYRFNATDADEDILVGDISPKNPFYILYLGRYGYNMSLFTIISAYLDKSRVGNYSETISVDDESEEGSCCVDTFRTNITVIEVNNQVNLFGIGAQTVWTKGDNSTFYYQMWAEDVEDGNSNNGDINFTLNWAVEENLFTIDSNGIMNWVANESLAGHTYSLQVCARDRAVNYHPNISLCAPYNYTSTLSCDNFTLTVTGNNRVPEITNYTPSGSLVSVYGENAASFWASVRDPDGTVPDINWYVDGVLIEHNENMSNDSFNYTPPCGFEGDKTIRVITSDGLLTKNVSWILRVSLTNCSVSAEGGGGGGGGGGAETCWEEWVCNDWNVCQSVGLSFESRLLSLDDYGSWSEICRQNSLDEKLCGFQIRDCPDLNKCNNSKLGAALPKLTQVCTYVENPGCFDGLKNCHSQGCELLVDCGGPCGACPTCSDGKMNQDEEGIDCGGSCPYSCAIESPRGFGYFLIIFLMLLFALIIFIIYKLLSIKRYRGKEEDVEKKGFM